MKLLFNYMQNHKLITIVANPTTPTAAPPTTATTGAKATDPVATKASPLYSAAIPTTDNTYPSTLYEFFNSISFILCYSCYIYCSLYCFIFCSSCSILILSLLIYTFIL
jgi:hypothetical protein